MNKEKIAQKNLLIITDDLNLDFGVIRIKEKGSDGGHNGLKNINEVLQTNKYNRMRFGIGGDFSKGKQSDYVLSQWSKKEKSELIDYKPLFNQIIRSYAVEGIGPTMNKFNKK
jgi:PTH1 family peptidyl-tRNA hydrolase